MKHSCCLNAQLIMLGMCDAIHSSIAQLLVARHNGQHCSADVTLHHTSMNRILPIIFSDRRKATFGGGGVDLDPNLSNPTHKPQAIGSSPDGLEE